MTLRDALTRLFTRNVVITRLPGNRLKAFDVNKSQSIGSPTEYSNRPKWRNGRLYNNIAGYTNGYANEEVESMRRQMYIDYELMDADAIIHSALDLYAEECICGDTIIPLLDGRRVTIKELYDNNESNLWLYGIDSKGQFVPVKADRIIYKGIRQCLKITLDDGTVIKCTPDHLWVMPDLSFKSASELVVGDGIYGIELKRSMNHRIVSIEYCDECEVYDVLNAGENHVFAIEANDGSKLYTHNCQTRDIHTNELLVIKSEDVRIKKLLHNLFYDVLNIEFNAFSWIRSMCKYGDMFLYLQIAEGHGVVNVQPIHPSLIRREEGYEDDPNQIVFFYDGVMGGYRSEINRFEAFEIAHFRLMTETLLLPYGMSILESARRDYRSWTLMQDAMLLHRIMRAPERRIYYIDVGNIAPEEIDGYVESIVNETKKTPFLDETGQINLRYNLMNMTEDVYMPIRGQQSGTKIDTLPGLGNEGMLEDVEYLRKKMMAALKIPPSYLGYEGEGETKSNLSSLDLRFGRTIERIQKIFVSEFYKIAVIHLYTQGFRNEDLLNFELEFTSPSLVFERQKLDILTAKVDLVKSIKEDNIFSDEYIYTQIFGMTEDEWKAEMDKIAESGKHEFRMQQIVEEGNDPKVSGKSFGTPHDIATMQVSSKFIDSSNPESLKQLYSPDEREENEGKPDQYAGSFETKRDQDFGRDPVGRKEMNKMESLLRRMDKNIGLGKKQTLTEGGLLDENRLIQDENEDSYT